jgi:hypothetical protein
LQLILVQSLSGEQPWRETDIDFCAQARTASPEQTPEFGEFLQDTIRPHHRHLLEKTTVAFLCRCLAMIRATKTGHPAAHHHGSLSEKTIAMVDLEWNCGQLLHRFQSSVGQEL